MKRIKDSNFLVVDVETTGLSPENNEIIEIGLVYVKNLKIQSEFSTLIRPKNTIPPFVQKITGISNNMIKSAPTFQEVSSEIMSFMSEKDIFVGHNVKFDYDMVNTSLERINQPKLKMPLLDTQFLTAIFCPTLNSHKLSHIAKQFGIHIADRHRALDDAKATAKILIKLLKNIPTLPSPLLHEINKVLSCSSEKWILKKFFLEQEQGPTNLNIGWKQFFKNRLITNFRKKNIKKIKQTKPIQIDMDKIWGDFLNAKNVFSRFEQRTQQQQMLSYICHAFNNWEHLVIEAGTGVGKSIIYLIAAIHMADKTNNPIIISTRTKTLQEQIINKDIPLLHKLVSNKFQSIVVKGRENYICLRKFMVFLKTNKSIKVIPFLFWLYYTPDGDLDSLHNSIIVQHKNYLKAQKATCLGHMCPYRKYCFLVLLKKRILQADIIIINHSILLIDSHSERFLLPEYEYLIIDEAHNLENSATNALSYVFSIKKAQDILNNISDQIPITEEIKENCKNLLSTFKEDLLSFKPRNINHKILLNAEVCVGKEWGKVCKTKDKLLKALDSLVATIKTISIGSDLLEISVRDTISKLEELQNILFLVFEPDQGYVAWLELEEKVKSKNIILTVSPVLINKLLADNLFDKKRSVILTSATLTVKNKFDYFRNRIGLNLLKEKEAKSIWLGSPFDFKKQTLFCIPRNFENPAQEDSFVLAVVKYLKKLLKITKGRSLILFTSYKMLREVYCLLKKNLKIYYPLLCQGKGHSRKNLLERFRAETNSVLLGTDSFWEGIDVPGISLSCVVIVKLPFPVPTDPLVVARVKEIVKKGGNVFYEYSIPNAVMKFKQGFGRLIRRKKDKGVVIVLDNRMLFKSYGNSFLRSIPSCTQNFGTKQETLSAVKKWLKY